MTKWLKNFSCPVIWPFETRDIRHMHLAITKLLILVFALMISASLIQTQETEPNPVVTSTFQSHVTVIGEIRYSPNGGYAAGVGVYTLRVWDTFTGELIISRNVDTTVWDAVWNPESTKIAVASGDGIVQILNVAMSDQLIGMLIAQFDPFKGSPRFLTAIDWSPNGKYLAIGGHFQVPIEFWDANNFTFVDRTDGGPTVGEMMWSPDGKVIATTYYQAEGLPVAMAAINYGANGYILCEDCPQEKASAIDWNSDGSLLAIGYDDGTVHIIDFATNLPVVTFTSGTFINSVSWSYDDKFIVTQKGIWEAETGELVEPFDIMTFAVDFSPIKYEIAYFDNDAETLVVKDVSVLIQEWEDGT